MIPETSQDTPYIFRISFPSSLDDPGMILECSGHSRSALEAPGAPIPLYLRLLGLRQNFPRYRCALPGHGLIGDSAQHHFCLWWICILPGARSPAGPGGWSKGSPYESKPLENLLVAPNISKSLHLVLRTLAGWMPQGGSREVGRIYHKHTQIYRIFPPM